MLHNDLIRMPITRATCPEFFDYEKPTTNLYKVYNDGGHFIASLVSKCKRKYIATPDHIKSEDDYLFDSLHFNAVKEGLKGKQLAYRLSVDLQTYLATDKDMTAYVDKKLKRKLNNLQHRKKRFKRKANLNPWTHFVTITYDDKLHTEDSFRKKLRRCLSNLHTRRGWRYMGVFERGSDTDRLHFHGILYIPDRQMIGGLFDNNYYDTTCGQMKTITQNTFFAENFGRNDFKEINCMDLKNGNSVDYILKYIGKTNERIVYSRGIPTEVFKLIHDSQIITEMQDFVTKFILFDDVVDWERDVAKHRIAKQMTFIDLYCNPVGE